MTSRRTLSAIAREPAPTPVVKRVHTTVKRAGMVGLGQTSGHTPAPAPALGSSDQWLQGVDLRITSARTAVLSALAQASSWLSHTDLAAALAAPLDRVTLYRTLDTLVEAGLVARDVGADRIGRFALAVGGAHDEHAHFRCGDCGRVFCLPMQVPRRTQVPDGFAVTAVDLNVRGRCSDCAVT